MIEFIMSVYAGLGVSQPFLLHILTSATFTVGLVLTVVLIGRLVDCIEVGNMRFLSRFIGKGFASFVCNRLTFPGIIVHELSHALFIWAAGGQIVKVRLLSLGGDGRLGYVEFKPSGSKLQRSCQLAFGSCAPVLVGLLLEILFMYLIFNVTMPFFVCGFLWYMAVSVFFHMSMSSEDMKNYFKGMRVVFFIIMVFTMARIYFFM